MKTYKLGQICHMKSGGTPKRGTPDYYGGSIPWVKISDFNSNSLIPLEKTEETLTRKGLEAINNRVFKKGTLLLAMYGSVGKVNIAGLETSCNQAILGITPKDESILNLNYLKYWFEHNKERLVNQGRGVTLNNISATIVKKQEIDLPDLQTQNKIVAILDKASALLQKREESIHLLDKLLRAQFLEMFGDSWLNSKNWKLEKIRALVSGIKSGWSIGGNQRKIKDGEFGVLKVSAVSTGKFNPEEYKVVPTEKITKTLVHPLKGDLLFSRANTSELVGATCIVLSDYNNLFLPDKLWKVIPKDNKIKNEYLNAVLSNKGYRNQISRLATGSSGSMQNISMQKLRDIMIPVPPIELQKKYAQLFWTFNESIQKQQSSFNLLTSFYNSLLQNAFNGKLNFDEDTALDVLLESINLEEEDNELGDIALVYLRRLIERLEAQKFEDMTQYQKAKHALQQLLREEKVTQVYDAEAKRVKLEMA